MGTECVDKPIITVITAIKNLYSEGRDQVFKRAVLSVKTQDYPNIEHIIIDGASTDETLNLCEELGLNYYSEKDKNVYEAFNRGISRAKGKYIAFLGSDDYYINPSAFSEIIEELENTQADFLYAPILFTDKEKSRQFIVKPSFSLFSIPFCHQSMFVTKKMLEELGLFDETYTITADYKLINQAILNGYTFTSLEFAYVVYTSGGLSSVREDVLEHENIRAIQESCMLTKEEAGHAYKHKCVTKNKMKELIKKYFL